MTSLRDSIKFSTAERKVSSKAVEKRLRKHLMLFIVLFAAILPISNAQTPNSSPSAYGKFQADHQDKVDISAIKTCYTLGGKKFDEVQPGNPDKGYKCTVKLAGLSGSPEQAKEYCESRIPFYIIAAKDGPMTECTFQINLKCTASHWQIRGKCYQVTSTRFTWEEAQKVCNVSEYLNPRVAEFYDEGLHNYFRDILNVYDAWVSVPDLKDYYKNGKGNAAVYVNQGAYKYDTRPGDILMDDLSAKHQVMCEYTPEMTMAELFYIGEIYSEIYPLTVYHSGAVIPSANFETIEHQGGSDTKPLFSTKNLKNKCMSIGKILNVDSYPITPIEEEFSNVKGLLKDHHFYLTNAFKNDGNEKSNFKHPDEKDNLFPMDEDKSDTTDVSKTHSYSISQAGRFPTMASMRAPVLCTLHTFQWNYAPCPPAPSWSEPPVSWKRVTGEVVCHYINNYRGVTLTDAMQLCEEDGFGAALTGFDSEAEFDAVRKHVIPENYRPNKDGKRVKVWEHFWLGGISPCQVDCNSRGRREVASWNKGVALNTTFLNDHKHDGHEFIERKDTQYVSLRSDNSAFHLHKIDEEFEYMLSICGKSAPLVRGARVEAKVKG